MRLELKSIGYWSLIKISFIVNLVIGFIIGLFYALFMGAFLSLMGNMSGLTGMPMGEEEIPSIGFLIVFMPFFFSFFGAVVNTILLLICTFVYNLSTKLVGGLEFTFSEMQPIQQSYAAPPPPQASLYGQPNQSPPPPPPPVEPLPPNVPPPSDNPSRDKDKL